MRAIFLDRDGVINENRDDHVKSWSEFVFLPGVFQALQLLQQAEFPVFVVTNQAIVSRGLATAATLEEIHRQMRAQIALQHGAIQDIRYCPHDYADVCTCRKPKPGMLLDLAQQWQIDLAQSWFIGDALTDMAAGNAAGCRSILVRTGRGAEQATQPEARRLEIAYCAADLLEAVAWVLEEEGFSLTTMQPREPEIHQPTITSPIIALSVGG